MDRKKTWRKKVREYLAIAFGGKCTICGYCKTISALDYHHVDPKQKDAQLSSQLRNGGSWSKIIKEAKKCTILCCRCHREVHAGVTKLPDDYARFDENKILPLLQSKQKVSKKFKCRGCGVVKNGSGKFCSPECSSKNQVRFTISQSELQKLIQSTPLTVIGKMYGVSDNAIRKRCKKFGLM